MPSKEHANIQSTDVAEEQRKKLKELFPEVFTEGKIDFDKLRATLGDLVDDRPERYLFTWAGKTEAIRSLQTPSRATLIPCPEESINFETANHIFIEGENLEVLKLLLKPYFGRVKMIYIDPPYNKGNDFVYRDNYKEPLKAYLEQTGQVDGNGNHLTSKLETNGRYHSAWLSMMYPRLFLARQLLRDDGVIFVSIDDHEVHNLRLLMNEIFGEENFIDCIIWKKRYGGGAKEKYLVSVHEYVLMYAKNETVLENIFVPLSEESIKRYYTLKDSNFSLRGPYRTHPLEATKSMGERQNLVFPIPAPDGTEIWPKRQWLWSKERVMKALDGNELEFLKDKEGNWSVHTKQYLKDENGNIRQGKAFSLIDDIYTQHGTNEIIELFQNAQIFSFPKPSKFLKKLIQIGSSKKDDIIIDFFSGSCTTAHAVLDLNKEDNGNRKFIMVQLPEPCDESSEAYKAGYKTIADIGKERIRRVIRGYGDNPKPIEGVGFKVFKLAASNFKQWEDYTGNDMEKYLEQLALFQTPLKDDRRDLDVIYEVLLKEGYDLNSRIEQVKDVTGHTVYRVTDPVRDQSFYICLDERINLEALEPLTLKEDDLFVCLDAALDDTTKVNLDLQCRIKAL